METKLLFFLLSGILFQSNIGIYMMEQTEKCQGYFEDCYSNALAFYFYFS